uniref:Bromodomain-containing protein 1-like n=1 Tax=Sinocyclocheilus grahami TaxID=75366 RepID=A0A672LFJ0_SINGR
MKKKVRHNRLANPQRPPSPIKPSRNRETLTYAEAQRMVELEIDGRVHRLSIYDKLDVIDSDDPLAQEISECTSNKENTEKPQQVLVRSVRLKNNQQKKSAALTTVQGSPAQGRLPEPKIRTIEYNLPAVPRRPSAYYTYMEKTLDELDEVVEYDMDEEDYAWLELINEKRKTDGYSQVSQNVFEFLMDRFEKESFFESQGQGDPQSLIDEDAVCCICMDGECQNSNAILFCDMCNLAVHQECYGVPHIPEGRWLCRHCLNSPSQLAECIFCPNKGGALKRTDDDRWGHVVCAIWVPEVGFTNTVFIEPIDGVANIPPARWKLTCYLCKKKGMGACIQCSKANCYTAFHVSCAQKAGLYMKVEPIKEVTESGATTFSVKKTAYCCSHTPNGCVRRPLTIYEDSKPKNGLCQKVAHRNRAKGYQKKNKKKPESEPVAVVPTVSGPRITPKSFNTILNQVSVQKKKVFVERVLSYWMLKRQSRNGVPLIRRLQTAIQTQKEPEQAPCVEDHQSLTEQLKDWHRLRHDLERARLLLELIRKREKLKRVEMKLQQSVLEMQLTPFPVLLRAVLDQLQEKDQAKIFVQPVSNTEVCLSHSCVLLVMLTLSKCNFFYNMKIPDVKFFFIKQGDKSLPPKLEPSDSVPLLKNSVSLCEPPTLKPIELSPEKCPKKVKFDRETFSTSLLNGLSSDVMPSENNVMVATSTLTEPANMVNRRTAVLFRKSKSPQKPSNTSESSINCPQLGTKTFLSVVIPRLETLLQRRKRKRSASGDSQGDEDECPIKRLDTGLSNGFSEPKKGLTVNRLSEPRRRCASESSISSSGSGSIQENTSDVSHTKSGKGKLAMTRRNTTDDKKELVNCVEPGNISKANKLAADHRSSDVSGGLPSQRRVHSHPSTGRAQGRRADAVQVQGETLPRPLLRQQTQLAMAS